MCLSEASAGGGKVGQLNLNTPHLLGSKLFTICSFLASTTRKNNIIECSCSASSICNNKRKSVTTTATDPLGRCLNPPTAHDASGIT
jgi:hypothetical protein